ncbi:MAG: polysaccharide deacetylase family protein [Pyrinomonadaceae bacterium]
MEVPILTYHSIDNSGSIISTSLETFRRQMTILSEDGYKVVPLNSIVDDLRTRRSFQSKTVVLTFDDGFENFYTDAYPVLDMYGFTATVFLVTDFCGGYNEWEGERLSLPRKPLLSWKQAKELSSLGIEFGSHTRTHPDLTRITAEQLDEEIGGSKAAIEDALGTSVNTFAYSYGLFDSSVKEIVKENFGAACSVKLGKVRTNSDPFVLERIDCYYLSNPKMFRSVSSKPIDYYLQFRQNLRDLKAFAQRA